METNYIEFNLNRLQLEMSTQMIRKIMSKPGFKERWLKIFKYYKSKGFTVKNAKIEANRITGIF